MRKFYPFNRSAVRRAHGSSAEHAMRDLIASNAPLREGRHTARQNGPKHYPGDPTGPRPLGLSFSTIFLQTKKDGATGGRWSSREVGKNVKRKISPPEVAGQAERWVITVVSKKLNAC